MNALDKLLIAEDIRRLKARYFRCLDTKNWGEMERVFGSDSVMDARAENRTGGTPDAHIHIGSVNIVVFLRTHLEQVTTVHHGHSPEIDITAPDAATGIWAMEDMLRWPEGGPLKWMHGYGHYYETYKNDGQRWYIQTTTIRRLRVDSL